MPRTTFLDGFSRFASTVTRWFPKAGAKTLDGVLYPLLGNPLTVGFFRRRNRVRLGAIKKFERFLIISDIHIGDAVLFQAAVSALRDFFPEARIDYLVKESVQGLLEGHPDISDLWPAFTGGRFPNERDVLTVRALSAEYDAVFNFCPFFPRSTFPPSANVFHFTGHAPAFVRNERHPILPNHISYQAHRFIHDLFSPSFPLQRARPFQGPEVFLATEAIQEAVEFFASSMFRRAKTVVFLNPDTASPYTRIPLFFQTKLLQGLARMSCTVFLGEGHTEKGIGGKLLNALSYPEARHVTLVPASLSLEAYTALMDWSDIFISGDTGPLHLAAARKKDRTGRHSFRNQTAVLGIFGATPPRFSGYDSRCGYLESGQDAECHSYQSGSLCRNLTCMHKMAKECDASGCFQSLDVDQILSHVRILLKKPQATLHGSYLNV